MIKNKLYKKYCDMSFKDCLPFSMNIVNLSCNLNCKYCFLKYVNKSSNLSKLSIKEYNVLFNQLIESGVVQIQFTGGEPLLIDNFFDIVKSARSKGFRLTLATNATLLAQQDIPFIVEMFDEIQISLDSLNEEECDYLWGVKGHYKHVLNIIDILSTKNIELKVNTVVTKYNVVGAADLHNFIASKYEIHHGLAFSLLPFINKPNKIKEFQINEQEFDLFQTYVSSKLEKKRLYSRENKWICGMTKNTLTMDEYGFFYPCLVGVAKLECNIKNCSFNEIFYGDEVENIRSKIKSVEYVQGCPMYNYITRGELF